MLDVERFVVKVKDWLDLEVYGVLIDGAGRVEGGRSVKSLNRPRQNRGRLTGDEWTRWAPSTDQICSNGVFSSVDQVHVLFTMIALCSSNLQEEVVLENSEQSVASDRRRRDGRRQKECWSRLQSVSPNHSRPQGEKATDSSALDNLKRRGNRPRRRLQ